MIGILGAGLSGLFLASILQDEKKEFEILEKADIPGGLCRSTREGGFTFDNTGGHIIYSKDKAILDKILSILGDNAVKRRRNIKIYYKDRYVKYPFENSLSDLTKEDNFECLIDFIETLTKKQNPPENFEEWIYQTFGKSIAEKYLIPYSRKIWKTDLKEIATFWIENRVPKPPAEDIIKSSLGIETEGYTHQLFFYYPESGGIQSLTDILAEKVRANLITNFDIKQITKKQGKWIVSDGKETKTFDNIVSTIPIQELLKAMKIPNEVSEAVKDLKYNSMMTVMLGVNGIKIPPYHGIYIPDPEVIANRIVLLNNMSSKVSPEGTCSIMAEVSYKDQSMSNEELIETISSYIRKMFGDFRLVFSKVVRNKYAYVIYDLGYNKNMKVIEEFLEQENIKVCGRFAEFKYLNMDDCIKSAIRVAKEL